MARFRRRRRRSRRSYKKRGMNKKYRGYLVARGGIRL